MPDKKTTPPVLDPDATLGSCEDQADIQALRLQVPFRGVNGGSAFDLASPGCDVDSLPGENGEHGQHSGEDTRQKP